MVAELIGFRRPEFTYASSRNPVVTHDRTSVPVLSRLHGEPCRRLLHCTIYSTSPSNPPLIRPYEPGLTGKCCSATLTHSFYRSVGLTVDIGGCGRHRSRNAQRTLSSLSR